MKSMLSSGIFWGSILILIGLSIILKIIFGINIPILRILFAFLLIYAGISLITGISFTKGKDDSLVFGKSETNLKGEKAEYNVVFGKSTILLEDKNIKKAEVNVVFGDADLIIDESLPVIIKADAAFGAANFPDETTISFGERTYRMTNQKENEAVMVNASVVFGNLKIKIRKKVEAY